MEYPKSTFKPLVLIITLAVTAYANGSVSPNFGATVSGGADKGQIKDDTLTTLSDSVKTANSNPSDNTITLLPLPITSPSASAPLANFFINDSKDLANKKLIFWPTKPTTSKPKPTPTIPALSADPSINDSRELADKVPLSSNQYVSNSNVNNWQANRYNLKDAHDQGLYGTGVKVGIVDHPVDPNHPDIPKNMVYLGEFGSSDSGKNRHGTQVALSMVSRDVNGQVLGIAPNIDLYTAAASYKGGEGVEIGATVKALNALNAKGVKIVNNSYGNPDISDYQDWAKEYLNAANATDKNNSYIGQLTSLVKDNMLMVWAAGNYGTNQPLAQDLFPLVELELQKGLITVVGVDADNNIDKDSNRCGDAKNWCMAAEWETKIPNLFADNDQMVDMLPLSVAQGTSFSAPKVTAAAALVAQKYPWMTNDNLRTTLLTTATDLGAKGVDSVYGWGLLNIGKAVNGPAQFAFGDFSANVSKGNYTFSNDINGEGGLIKNGEGTLVLQGNHTYQGKTQVNTGTLAINGSNASQTQIAKNGTYQVKGQTGSVKNLGRFISDDATINGDFTQTSKGTFQTQLGSLTTIKGTATLAGHLYFDTRKAGFIPKAGIDVPVINAEKRKGKFADTQLSANLLLNGKTTYVGNNVNFNVTQVSVAQALKDNEILTRGIADTGIKAAANTLDDTFDRLDPMSFAQKQDARTQKFLEGATNIQNVQSAKELQRSLYSLSGTVYSNANVVNTLAMDKVNKDFMSSIRNDAVQAEAIVSFNHAQNRWNPAGIKGKQNTNSGMLGANKKLGDGLSGAVAYTFQNSNWSEQDSSAKIKSNGLTAGLFYAPENWHNAYVSGSMAYNRFSNDVTRQVWLGAAADEAGTKTKGNLWQLTVLGGKAFAFNRFSITPSLGLRYDYLQQNGFDEEGALGFGLHAHKLNKGVTVGLANVLGQYRFDVNNTLFTLFGSVGLEHDFQDRDYATKGGFVGLNTDTRAGSWSASKNRWDAALGGSVRITPKINAGVVYQYENGSHWHSNTGKVNLKVKF